MVLKFPILATSRVQNTDHRTSIGVFNFFFERILEPIRNEFEFVRICSRIFKPRSNIFTKFGES